jgi:hypothetical protein
VELIRAIGRQAFVVYVAMNMALCAVLFVPWALPRETISGLIGRWAQGSGKKAKFARHAAKVIDRIYFWEPNHCKVTAEQEAEARKALRYP